MARLAAWPPGEKNVQERARVSSRVRSASAGAYTHGSSRILYPAVVNSSLLDMLGSWPVLSSRKPPVP